jgi:hypothetical protein
MHINKAKMTNRQLIRFNQVENHFKLKLFEKINYFKLNF